jgi:TetR/AcrR family transcriptional regulator, regulator of biofilm formation and stress response
VPEDHTGGHGTPPEPGHSTAGRVRRFDPHRRERILDAAIDVIAAHGVAGTTHRLIAAAADVPLGSLTYHFTGLDDLRAQAFARLAERVTRSYQAHFEDVRTPEEFVEAVTTLVHDGVGADADEWVVTYELYLAALRDPRLRSVTEAWMRASRSVLERFVDPDVARDLDALVEGLIMHRTLSTSPPSRAQTRAAVVRAIGPRPD